MPSIDPRAQTHPIRAGRLRAAIALAAASALVSAPRARAEAAEIKPVEALTRNTFADIAEKTLPSVVSVYVKADIREQMKRLQERLGPLKDKLFEDPQFREFFKNQQPDGDKGDDGDDDNDNDQPGDSKGDPHKGMMETKTSGSGVIISEDGYIVTNLHIVDGAKDGTVSVVLNDDTEVPADKVKIIATDDLIDLAILKIDAGGRKLQPLPWGDSNAMRIGDWVVAIGNPLDLRGSVSSGIISAKARKIEKVPIEHLIQTDAMINPGNSGGALVNLSGELIGINMAIATNTGFFQGIGFAIPSRDARFVADQVIRNGKVKRGYIGIEMGKITDDLRSSLGLSDEVKDGIVVTNVVPGAPADKAGVQAYDVIVQVDDARIKETSDLLSVIAGKQVGDTADLKIMRESKGKMKEMNLVMKVSERPSSAELERQREEAPEGAKGKKPEEAPKDSLGLQLKPYDRAGARGMEIEKIDPRSPAAKAGLAVGDVILEINRKAISSPEAYQEAIAESKGDRPLLLRVLRAGARIFKTIEKPTKEK